MIYVDRNVDSVHSRLIGEQVEARLTAETVEVWYAGQKVEQLPRLRGRGKHRVDYRHIIDWDALREIDPSNTCFSKRERRTLAP